MNDKIEKSRDEGLIREGPSYLGDFELLVLLSLTILGSDAYGIAVQKLIQERAGRPASIGAVYTTLDRLERKKFVSSVLTEPTQDRGGRARRYFTIEAAGLAALKQSLLTTARMTRGMEAALGLV